MGQKNNKELTEIEIRRYTRQIELDFIQHKGQQKIKNAKILLVGVGGIGTATLHYLAAAGVGTIGICDYSTVNESQFHRQIMFGTGDLGKLKTIVAKEKLTLLNPFVNFNIHNIEITNENVNVIVSGYDIVIDSSNEPETNKTLLSYLANKTIPLIIAITHGLYGEILVCSRPKISLYDYIELSHNKNKGQLGAACGLVGTIVALQTILYLTENSILVNKYIKIDGFQLSIEDQTCE